MAEVTIVDLLTEIDKTDNNINLIAELYVEAVKEDDILQNRYLKELIKLVENKNKLWKLCYND